MTPPSRSSRLRLPAFVALGVLLAAGAAGLALRGTAGAQAPSVAPATPTVPVTVAAAVRRDVPVMLGNIGTVQANQSVLVRARVDGTLDRVLFDEGQDVKPGDLLAVIDPRPFQAVLDQVQAKRAQDDVSLTNAQRDLARYSALAQRDFASRQQVDTQTALVAQLQATLRGDDAAIASARLNLGFTSITSPIDGRTGLRLVDAGNLIHASDATGIVTITQLHPISVLFTLPQDQLPTIQTAMAKGALPVAAYAADNTTLLGQGKLLTIDNNIDQTTGTIKLKASFPNLDNRLWPGQFVHVAMQIGTMTNALTVASPAVQHGPSGLFIYVVKTDSTVAMQPVEVAQDDGRIAVISKGLDESAQVVTNGQSRLQNGTRVTATAAKASS
ncbi:MAG: efflux RND transporter periplasmic adaptor subunit [Nevskiales bacterium]